MANINNQDRKLRRTQNRSRSILRRPNAPKIKIAEGDLRAVATPSGVFLHATIGGRTYKTQMPMVLESSPTMKPQNTIIKLEMLSPVWGDAKYEMARNLKRIIRALGFKDTATKGRITEESGSNSSSGGGSGSGGGGGSGPPPAPD